MPKGLKHEPGEREKGRDLDDINLELGNPL